VFFQQSAASIEQMTDINIEKALGLNNHRNLEMGRNNIMNLKCEHGRA